MAATPAGHVTLATPPNGAAAGGLIILTVLGAVPDILAGLGVDVGRVFAAAGVDPNDLRDPGATIPYAAMGRLLKQCVARSGCPHFGLLAGERVGLPELGVVGFLVRHSPEVGVGLRNLAGFLHHYQRGGAPTLVCEGDVTRLGYRIYHHHVEAAEQIYDGAMAVCSNILRTLCGPDWAPLEVAFTHSRPVDVAPYERVLRAPLRFDAAETCITFASRWLTQPVPDADPTLYRVLQRQIDRVAAADATTLQASLRGMVRSLLLAGRCSADEAAALFGIHRRTLHRRLKAEGVTFEAVVEEVRSDLAQELLTHGHTPLSHIAATLGYADVGAFARAFHRWYGMSPARWRAAQQGLDASPDHA